MYFISSCPLKIRVNVLRVSNVGLVPWFRYSILTPFFQMACTSSACNLATLPVNKLKKKKETVGKVARVLSLTDDSISRSVQCRPWIHSNPHIYIKIKDFKSLFRKLWYSWPDVWFGSTIHSWAEPNGNLGIGSQWERERGVLLYVSISFTHSISFQNTGRTKWLGTACAEIFLFRIYKHFLSHGFLSFWLTLGWWCLCLQFQWLVCLATMKLIYFLPVCSLKIPRKTKRLKIIRHFE